MSKLYCVLLLISIIPFAEDSLGQVPTADGNQQQSTVDWNSVPNHKLEPKDPPDGWTEQSDEDHGIRWYSPSKPKKTMPKGDASIVIYDALSEKVVFSISCVEMKTPVGDQQDQYLDSFDDSFLKAYHRAGINAQCHPISTVSYLGATGRFSRIKDPQHAKVTLKCDLMTPHEHYSILAIGPEGEQLESSLMSFITSIRFDSKP